MIRQKLYSLLRQPAFSLPALLAIALGLGVTTAVFSLVYAILLRPFPYPEPDRLVRVFTVMTKEQNAERNCSLLDIEEYNRRAKLLRNFGAYTSFDSQIEGDGSAEAVSVAQLNQEALRAVGVRPILGRLFLPEEDRHGGPVNKAILSHSLWLNRYGGDRGIIGRTIRTPLSSFEVIGVMPLGFSFPDRAALWLTMESWYALEVEQYRRKQRDQRWYATIARLEPGVTLKQAQAEIDTVSAQLAREFPKENVGVRAKLVPLREAEVGPVKPYLILLLGGVGLVLLICIANVANLMFARVLAQRRQYAVQAALGANWMHLVKGPLVESLILAVVGGAFGALLAWGGVHVFQLLLPDSIPGWMHIEVDWTVLEFCLLLTVFTGIAFALAPAWASTQVDLNEALKQGTRGGTQRSAGRSILVITEVAFSLALLVGAGLLMKTFLQMQNAHHGFLSDNLLVARVINSNLGSGPRASRAASLSVYHMRVMQELAALPGVTSVAAANSLPYSGGELRQGRLRIQGRSDEELQFLLPIAGADVSLNYFETMKIPLRRGRFFERSDSPDAAPVVILNEDGAKALFGDRDPIGQLVQWGDTVGPSNPYCRVVGVVGNVKQEGSAGKVIALYYPFTQWPIVSAYYLLRANTDQARLNPTVRQTIRAADSNAAIVWIKAMISRIDEALWQRRLWGVLFTVFAGLAITLAGVGLYGLLNYAVIQGTREIGIQLAVGALPSRILLNVIFRGLKLVATGLVAGLIITLASVRVITHLLTDVNPYDWTIYATVIVLLGLVGIAASVWPALRASRVDPVIALRAE